MEASRENHSARHRPHPGRRIEEFRGRESEWSIKSSSDKHLAARQESRGVIGSGSVGSQAAGLGP